MRKLKIILFIFVATTAWHFIDVNTTKHQPVALSCSSSSLFASAATQPYKTSPGYVGFLTDMLSGEVKKDNIKWFDGLYSFSRGLLNLILLAFLVYVAIRNILSLGIESYTIKKILPKLIFAAFLGNLVRPIMAVGSRIVDSIILAPGLTIFRTPSSWSWYGSVASGGLTVVENLSHSTGGIISLITSGLVGLFAAFTQGYLIFLAILVINALMIGGMLIIALFHTLAPWIVLLATAVGPIAVGLSILPETESLYKKWLKIIIFWLFFPLILNAVHYLIDLIPSIEVAQGQGNISAIISSMLPLLIKIGLYTLAIRIPFTWEKDVGGLIASLPSTTAKTWNQARGTVEKGLQLGGRVVMAGRQGEYWLKGKASQAGKREAAKTAATEAADELNDASLKKSGTEKDQVVLKQYKLQDLLAKMTSDEEAVTNDTLFGGRATLQGIRSAYAKYNRGEFKGKTDAKSVAAQTFFDKHKREAEDTARINFVRDREAEKINKGGENEVKRRQGIDPATGELDASKATLPFKLARGVQKWSIGNLPVAHAAREEAYQKEFQKTAFRYDILSRKVAGPLADLSSQTDRKAADFAVLKSSEKVEEQMSGTLLKMATLLQQNLSKNSRPISLDVALSVLQNDAQNLDEAAETKLLYLQQLGGMKGKYKGQTTSVDTNDLGTLISGHNRLRDLAASEARANRSADEMKFLRDQRVGQAYARATGSSPSGGIATANDPGSPPLGVTNKNYIPRGTRRIIDGLTKIDDTLAQKGGLDALQETNKVFEDNDLRDITVNDYNQFSGENEGILQEIGRLVADKSDRPAADNFVNQVKLSHGLDTPEMLRQAGQFNDPEISRMVIDYNRRQKMELVILSRNEDARALQSPVKQIIARATSQPEILNQIRGALDTYTRSLNEGSDVTPSVTPSQAYDAKRFLATQAGFSDPNSLTTGVVAQISRAFQATTVREPSAVREEPNVNKPEPTDINKPGPIDVDRPRPMGGI